jgi:hypothetical protein
VEKKPVNERWWMGGPQFSARGGSKTRSLGARAWRPCLLALLLGDLAACSLPVKQTAPFNHALNYVPWSELSNSANVPAPFPLQPGMRLSFNAYTGSQLGEAFAVPIPTGYQYDVPSSPLGPADYFFLSYILTAGHIGTAGPNLPGCLAVNIANRITLGAKDHCIDPVQELDNRRAAIPQIAAAMLQSLLLYVVHKDLPTGTPDSAALLKAWTVNVDPDWLGNPNPGDCAGPWQRIAAQAPLGTGNRNVELDLYDWSTPAFTEDPFLDCPNYSANRWYQDDDSVARARGYVTVEIPVHIVGDGATRHVPLYWSYAELEQALSDYTTGAPTYTVKGFRRNVNYLPDVSAVSDKPATKEELTGERGYFTVWFSGTGGAYGAKRYFNATEKDKAAFLVAAGDVIYLKRTH